MNQSVSSLCLGELSWEGRRLVSSMVIGDFGDFSKRSLLAFPQFQTHFDVFLTLFLK